MARADDVRNWNSHSVDRSAGLFLLAQSFSLTPCFSGVLPGTCTISAPVSASPRQSEGLISKEFPHECALIHWMLRSPHKTKMVVRRETILYACKIKKTTNGSRSCACSEARQAFQVVA